MYIYEELYNKVMCWVFDMKKIDRFYFRSPNNKDNFPYYLRRYMQEMGGKE